MLGLHSLRSKLQFALLTLGMAAMGLLGWDTWRRANNALREATFERLTAIAETRRRHVERYFTDLAAHVAALSNDESTIEALEEFSRAWDEIPPLGTGDPGWESLRAFYRTTRLGEEWLPVDPRAARLQTAFVVRPPDERHAGDLRLEAPSTGPYSRVHSRYHPTLDRYRTAFGLYDIFLIEGATGRVLYTSSKETDLGTNLRRGQFSTTGLAHVFEQAKLLDPVTRFAFADYAPYAASDFAPAAFVGAPILRAGEMIGVLAIQVSIEEVNGVMTSQGRWREEGLGATGQIYLVGPDGTLRSDVRGEVEDSQHYVEELRTAGVDPKVIAAVQQNGTAILTQPAPKGVDQRIRQKEWGTATGVDIRGRRVLRAIVPLDFGGLGWALVAEMEAAEALAPAATLGRRALGFGLLTALAFLITGSYLAAMITRPLKTLAQGARLLGAGQFSTRVPIGSDDEIGQLSASFNRMASDLEQTTVSKTQLEALAQQLITTQEEERSRLARELHDDVTQRMAAVAIDAGALVAAEGDRRRQLAERVKAQVGELSKDIHNLSRRLHPSILDDLGLVSALESECRAFTERTGIRVETHLEAPDPLQPEVALTAYRIVQEALRNVQRHSGASRVRLTLEPDGTRLRLRVEDNGQGFDRANAAWRPGLGLASMDERVKLHGGRMHIDSQPGYGTSVEALL